MLKFLLHSILMLSRSTFFLMCLSVQVFAANELAQTFTVDGQLMLSGTTTVLADASALVTVQILDPSKTCLLYAEQQTVNTMASDGYFSIQVGSVIGNSKRTSYDPGLSMAQVYQNTSAVTVASAPGATCAGGTYTPVANAVRYFRIIVTPSSTNVADTLSPDTVLDAVPMATVAQSLQGYAASDFLAKAGLPTCASGTFLSYDGATLSCAGVSGASGGTVTSITAGTGLSGGTITTSGTIALTASGVTAATYGSATQVPVIAVDTYGRVTSATNTTISGVVPGGTASGDLSGTYPSPTVNGLSGVALSISSLTSGQYLKYNGTNWINSTLSVSDSSITYGSETQNTFLAAPNGSNGTPSFRAIAAADLPVVPYTRGGTSLSATPANGQIAIGNGAGYTLGTLTAGSGVTITNASGSVTIAAAGSGGTVTSVSGTAPISVATGTTTPVVSITQATSSTDGYLSSTDWTTFNSKLTGTLADAKIFVGNSSSVATPVSMSGDATLADTGALTLAASGVTAGTYPKVTVNTKGLVTSGTTLSVSDIPSLPWSQITSGTPTTLAGYGITNAVQNLGGSPGVQTGADASKPTSPTAGTIYFATDTKIIYQYNSGAWVSIASSSGSGGTVTSASVTSANGFAGTVATATTTPAITITTSVTGMVKGNGTALSAATAGTDYSAGTSSLGTGLLKSTTGTGALSIAAAADITTALGYTPVNKAGDSMSGNLTFAASIGNIYTAGSGANTVTVEGPSAAIGTSYVLRLPTSVASSTGQVLTSDTSGNLSWSTPSTTATSYSGILPIANGGTNSSTVLNNNQLMVSSGGKIIEAGALTNGQLFIGSTGAAPVAASLTAGSGITITPAAGVITIATTGLQASSLANGDIWVGQTGTPTAVAPSGDVTMTNAGVFTVTQIQGKAVSATQPSSTGQVLRYNGTNWTPNFLSMFDLRSTITGSQAFGGVGCLSNQTLTWTAATDNLSCSNIAISGTQVTYTSQTANTFFAAPNGSAGAPTFRAIASADLPAGMLSGSGTANYVPYYSTATTLANSPMYISSSSVGIGTTAPGERFQVAYADASAYSPSSSTLLTPWTSGSAAVVQAANTSWTSGTAAYLSLNTINASDAHEIAYLGAVSGSSYSPTIVLGARTGITSYAEWMRIDTSGDVGIGTTSPAQKLSVVGTVQSTTGGFMFPDGTTQTSAASAACNPAITGGASVCLPGTTSLQSASTGGQVTALGYSSMSAAVSGTQDSAVGAYSLQDNTSGSYNAGIGSYALQNNVSGSQNVALGDQSGHYSTGSYNVFIGQGAGSNLTAGNSNIFIGQGVQPNISTTGSNQLNIGNWIYGNAGSIGIGTTSPTLPFYVLGGATLQGGQSTMGLDSSSGYAGLMLLDAGTSRWLIRDEATTDYLNFWRQSGTSASPTWNAAMTMQNSTGYVGIGMTPTNPLTVSGTGFNPTTNASANLLISSPGYFGGGVLLKDTTYYAGMWTSSNGSALAFGAGGTTSGFSGGADMTLSSVGNLAILGCLTYNGGTSGTCLSDRRLKKDIRPFNLGLDKILGIQPVFYKYNGLGEHDADTKDRLGVIAQEVEKVAPELVETREVLLHENDKQKTQVKAVNYNAFTYMTINAIKELYKKWLDDSTTKDRAIASLKAENVQMKAETEKLKQENLEKVKEMAELKARMDRLEKAMSSK